MRGILAFFATVAVLVPAGGPAGWAEGQVVALVSEAEARLPDALPPAPFQGFGHPPGAEPEGEPLDRSPRIVVVSPHDRPVHSVPLDIDIRFIPQDETAIDLATLDVKYLKLLSIDITDRVRPYASPEGICIEKAAFPPGKRTILISIADTRGRLASRALTVTVQ
jgi:hypothetical protein